LAADSGKTMTLGGYLCLMPSCAGHFEPRGSRIGQFKSTINVKNFIRRFYWSICCDFDTIRSWNVCRSPKSPKIHKNPYFTVQGHPRSLISVPIKSQGMTSY